MKTLCWKGWLGVAALAAVLAVLPFGGTSKADAMKGNAMMMKKIDPTLGASAMNMANAKVIATSFYADWCPLCKHMMPAQMETMKWLKTEMKPVGMVRFDFSNKTTIAASKALAAKQGLADLYSRHEGKTGFVFLLNANNHKLISTIVNTDTAAQMQSKINNAIAAVNRSEKK
ncbi:MAG: thioredoxin domain-containing protein [Abditibacteriaceae bacterium]